MMYPKGVVLKIVIGLLFSFFALSFMIQAHADQLTGRTNDVLAFLNAARANDIENLSRGLALGIAVDSRDSKGRTALLIATHANAIDAARLLIDAGADVNAKDDMNDSPYLYAGAEGRLKILKMTIAAGADLTSVNRYGGTALIPAAHHGHVDVVRYLLTTNIDVNRESRGAGFLWRKTLTKIAPGIKIHWFTFRTRPWKHMPPAVPMINRHITESSQIIIPLRDAINDREEDP